MLSSVLCDNIAKKLKIKMIAPINQFNFFQDGYPKNSANYVILSARFGSIQVKGEGQWCYFGCHLSTADQ